MRSGADRPAISTGPALMIPAGYPRDLPSALLRAARDFAGAGVVEIGPDGRETKLDFPTLLELAARILAGLRANGVRAGDPAVVHCTEPVGFFAAFWACTLGGIRPLLVAPNPGGDRTEEGRERLRRITDLLGWTVLIGRPSDLPNDLGLPVLDPDALAGHEPTSDFHRPAADDVAVLMLSSGSTGTPKIVQLTHRGLVEFAAGTPAMLPVRPGQTTLNWLPLDRSGAFLLYHLLPVFTGCTNIHVNTDWVLANPLRWFDLMEQHRVNHSWSPNFGYRLATAAVAGEPDRHWDLSALRSLVSGGEQITVPVMSDFLRVTNRFGVVPETFVAAWGMTETVTGITFARPGLTPNVHRVRIPPTGVVEWVDQRPSSGKVAVARPGAPRVEAPGVLSLVSVGAPAPGATVRIVAPNGAVLPEGRIGQLQVASARVTPGYLGNLEADRLAFPVGAWPARKWLATGDQGFITGGQVVITGRDSERIIMSGKLHYAHDIESVAATVVGAEPGLVAACGIADEETGTDRLVVFYALTPDSVPGMDQAIRSLIQTRLGLTAQVVGVPRRDFPTTPGGKILRPLLKQRWIDGTLDSTSHPHVEPAGATQSSGPEGQGPSTRPETTPYADEDPSERTTELPVVHLAWKRELQQSIPTPPERPTLGTPRTPAVPPAPSHPQTTQPAELPQDNVPVDRPQDNVSVERPQDNVSVERPQDNVSVERPQDNVSVELEPSPEPAAPASPYGPAPITSPADPAANPPAAASLTDDEPATTELTRITDTTPAPTANSTEAAPIREPAPTDPGDAKATRTDNASAPAEAITPDEPSTADGEMQADSTDVLKPTEAAVGEQSDDVRADEADATDDRAQAPASSEQAGTTDVGTADVGTADVGTADVGTADVGTADVGTADVGTADVGTADVGTSEPGTADAGTADAGTADRSVDAVESNGRDGATGEANAGDPSGADDGETAEQIDTAEHGATPEDLNVSFDDEPADASDTTDEQSETAETDHAGGLQNTSEESDERNNDDELSVEPYAAAASIDDETVTTRHDSITSDYEATIAQPDEPAEEHIAAPGDADATLTEDETPTTADEPTDTKSDAEHQVAADGDESSAAEHQVAADGDELSSAERATVEELEADAPGGEAAAAEAAPTAADEDDSTATEEVDSTATESAAVAPGEAAAEREVVVAEDASTAAEHVTVEENDATASEPETLPDEDDAVSTHSTTAHAAEHAAGEPEVVVADGDLSSSERVSGVSKEKAAGEPEEIVATGNSTSSQRATDLAAEEAAGESGTVVADGNLTLSPRMSGVDAEDASAEREAVVHEDASGVVEGVAGEGAEETSEEQAASEEAAVAEGDFASSQGVTRVVAEGAAGEPEVGGDGSAAVQGAPADAGGEAVRGAPGDGGRDNVHEMTAESGRSAVREVTADGGGDAVRGAAGGAGDGAVPEVTAEAGSADVSVDDVSVAAELPLVRGGESAGVGEDGADGEVPDAVDASGDADAAAVVDGADDGDARTVVDGVDATDDAGGVEVGDSAGGADVAVEALAVAVDSEDAAADVNGGVDVADEADATDDAAVGADAEGSGDASVVGGAEGSDGATAVDGVDVSGGVGVVEDADAAADDGVRGAGTEQVGDGAGRGGDGAARVVEPVAVVGVAGRFPGAETLEGFWENLVGGVESVRRGRTESGDGAVAVSGALEHVEAFDAKFFGLSDREAELMEPAQRLFLEVCHQALEHGGYAGTSARVGVFAGSGMNLYNRQHQSRDSIATRVAYRLGLTGPAIGVQSASSSSLVAVHLACQALRSGDADLALAGAAAVQVPQATTYQPTPDSILSPTGHVRAFAADADGTVGGNGVAAVLLKRLDQAIADGDTVYAVIRGSAVSNADGNQVELVERALQRAGFDADSLSYIEANGIGSPAADAAEVKALTTALRRHTDKVGFCTLGSVKPNIGHLDSAAGMAGLIKTILMLQHRTLVPTINYTKPNPDLELDDSPFVIGTDAREWTVPLQSGATTLRAGVSALDPSGTNAHVILEEAPRQIRRGDDGPVVLPLSAPDPDALADLVELYRSDLGHGTGHRLIDLAGTAALGRPAHRYRIAVAGTSEQDLVTALGSAQPTEVPRGGPGPLGYAFTGQGAARRGMAAGLAARFPVFRSVLDECDRVYHEETGGSLNELLLTPAGGAEGVWPTETAQPALFAFEVALARLWQSFGVQPGLVVGHSVGEYAALCVAGALSVADGVRLTAKRGELMQRGTVPGAMVAVRADADRVREIARTAGVEVAAGNGPQSFVLTGSEVIVGQLAAQLDQLQVAWQRLDVDRAFHSSLVDPILSDFAEIVREITLKPLRTPMVSSWSGDLLESGTVLDSDYLVGQLRQPVLFGDAVEAVTAAGCRRFLELGPDAVLSPAGRRIAPNSTWIPAQRLGQDPVLATMNGLAELYEQGTEIAWAKVYADSGRVPLPTYPFRRVDHPVDPSVMVVAGPGTAVAGDNVAPRLNAFERAARAQSVVFEPPSSAAVKRIPLDPPVTPEPVEEDRAEAERDEPDAFALPAETHAIDADYLAQAGSLAGNEMSAERYRESLNVVLDLTCEVHNLDPYDLTVDHTFAELGATPASMAPVLDELNSRFGAGLAPDDLFLTYTTPHKLATAVAVQTAEPDEPAVEELRAEEDLSQQSDEAEATQGASSLAAPSRDGARDPRAALAVLGSGLAELAAKVDEAAAATSAAELPGNGMAALMSQQLRVAGQLVEGVTQLMREQLALLAEPPEEQPARQPHPTPEPEDTQASNEPAPDAEGASDAGRQAIEVVATDGAATDGAATDGAAADGAAADGAAIDGGAVSGEGVSGGVAGVWDGVPVVPAGGGDMRRDLAYWEQVLAGAEPLVLPGDRVRGAGDDGVASVKRELDEELSDAVFAYSRERKLSPVMTMLAATATVLGRFAAQDDVTIGSALTRPQGDTSTDPLPALPLRIDLSGEPELGELTERIRDITTAALEHAGADLGFFERDPLFQILVEFEDGADELPPSVDLRFRLTHHGAGITCTADYRTGLFEQRSVERLLDYLAELLRRATTSPRLRLPELVAPIESDLELLRQLESESGPIGGVRRDAVVAGELSGLHTLFEQQVARTPDAIAVIQGDRELTYAELDRRANAVAWQLVDLGVKPGEIVAVRVARGTEMVVAVLAVLKSGAAYLPLDPGVPESRWAFMVRDAAAGTLVGDDAALADRLGLRLVPVAAADARARQAPPARAAADDVAYCIYTSGSSGNPKGVLVPHRGPVNLVRHYLRTRRPLRTLQWTSFGFDVHVQEMFTTLASGAALVLIGEDDRYDPDAVIAALRDHGVQRLFMAFSPLTALLATMRRLPELPALREIVAGGEAMVLTHKVREFLEAHPRCRLFNEYGPTEASIVTTIHEVDPAEDRPSIGRPIEGVAVRLLDAALRPVPVGAVGEIHLGGAAVAQGYLGRPEETERAFVGDPAHPGARLYRSRDLGRWRVDGTLEYLGRADDQVKIRGHRVEPGETEHVLADQPGVVDAVVVAQTDPAGDTCLIGYVVLEDSDPAVLARLMLDLGKELPIYLVPADLIPIEELPLDDNGRLDRARLPEPEWLRP